MALEGKISSEHGSNNVKFKFCVRISQGGHHIRVTVLSGRARVKGVSCQLTATGLQLVQSWVINKTVHFKDNFLQELLYFRQFIFKKCKLRLYVSCNNIYDCVQKNNDFHSTEYRQSNRLHSLFQISIGQQYVTSITTAKVVYHWTTTASVIYDVGMLYLENYQAGATTGVNLQEIVIIGVCK